MSESGGRGENVVPKGWMSLTDVGRLVGADRNDIGLLMELGYLPEPSRDGRVSLRAFIALLERSFSNLRLRRLRIAEQAVWTGVFARSPDLLGAVVGFRFAPGSLGEIVQAKMLRRQSLER